MHRLIADLLKHNAEQSAFFTSPDAQLTRYQYRVQHPTEIAAMKCMDGRVHLPVMTKTPFGILKPWRNLGGIFDLGWPHFGLEVSTWVDQAVGRGNDCIILVTYHFSAGHKHRGCRGFDYDVDKARVFTKKLREQFDHIFGLKHMVVYPIQLGIETDEDALIFHGANGKSWNLAEEKLIGERDLRHELERIYPDMKPRLIADLLPLVVGNIAHIAEVRHAKRPIAEAEHKERILGIGSGFDWLHTPNLALIVGPFSPNLSEPITTAAALLLSNIQGGRIPDSGIVLLSSAPYRDEAGPAPLLAEQKAKFMSAFALDVIKKNVPKLYKIGVHPLTVTLNLNTRKLDVIEKPNKK